MAENLASTLDGIESSTRAPRPKPWSRYAALCPSSASAEGMTLTRQPEPGRDHNMFAALMVREGDADAVLGGLTTFYPETIRPALQVLPMEPGRTIVSSRLRGQS